jgi:hypothetical protein
VLKAVPVDMHPDVATQHNVHVYTCHPLVSLCQGIEVASTTSIQHSSVFMSLLVQSRAMKADVSNMHSSIFVVRAVAQRHTKHTAGVLLQLSKD